MDIKSLDDIKKLPLKYKVLAVLGIFFLIGYFDWFYFLSSAMEQKTTLSAKLVEMQSKIKEKEKIAGQINTYIAQVAALTENYKTALLKLPDQREVPALFHSVALAGKDAGIEFLLFEPKASVPKVLDKEPSKIEKTASLLKPSDQKEQKPADASNAKQPPVAGGNKAAEPPPEPFYEEIPVGVTVVGSFQNILFFFEKVAKLPRIINVSDISMGDRKDAKGRGQVITASCTIKTYMFIDKKEKVSEKTK
jgi:type IV pilus assembly protein PilO